MTASIQSHIHLSDSLGTAPENAPTIKWKVSNRRKMPVKYYSITETLDGNVYAHVIGDSSPVRRYNYAYDVKVIGDNSHDVIYYEQLLLALDGKECYLCDNIHTADGTDHTAYVHRVLVDVGEIPLSVISLQFFYIPVTLYSLDNF